MKRLKTFVVLILISPLLMVSVSAGAEKTFEQTPVELPEIIVTATKTEKTLQDAPGSVFVVTRKEMQKKHVETVDDALNTIAGLYVKRSKGLADSTASVRMRGFSGDKYVLVLMDGQPLNDAYAGGVEWAALPIDGIERIEIIRGPASALYGGNAMGGVINIITKTPQKLELKASGGYGTHDTWRYRLSAGHRLWDKLSLYLGYEELNTDGYATTPVVRSITSGTGNVSGGYAMNDKYGNPTKWVVGDKGDNGAERSVANGKVTFDFSETGRLSFTAFSGDYEYDYGPPHTYMGTFGDGSTYAIVGPDQRAGFQPNDFISYTGIGKKETDSYALTFKNTFGPVEITAHGGTVQQDDRYTLESGRGSADYYDSPGTLNRTESESWFGEFRGTIPIGDSHLFTAGFTYRTDAADTNKYDIPFYRSFSGRSESIYHSGGNSKAWAVFVQDEWQIIDPLTVYLGARYDWWNVYDGSSGVPGEETEYDSNTEFEWSPKVAAVWKVFADTTLRASVGHAFRPPTIYELYRTWHYYSTTYQSNPGLKPETVWSYELGVEQYLFDRRTRISVTGYRNDTDDLIYSKVEDSTKTRTNAAKARTYGVELEVEQKVTDWLSLWGNFTYTEATIRDNPADPASEGKQVPGIPKTAWNFGIDTHYKWLKGSLVGRYFSKIYNLSDNQDKEEGVYGTYEPAFSLDAKVTLTPLKWLEVSLSVNNLLDDQYYEYYQSDGRTFFAEVTMRY